MQKSQNKNWGLLISQTPLADKSLNGAIVPANGYQHTKFQLSRSISFGDMRGPKIKSGRSSFHQMPPSRQTLHRALVLVNAYKCAKFQLPSSIS